VPRGASSGERLRLYDATEGRLDEWVARLGAPHPLAPLAISDGVAPVPTISRYPRDAFERDVRRILEYIAAGDTFQTVLSRRQEVAGRADPLLLYRYLRALNPAPYLFYLGFDEFAVVGSSPEVLVRVEGGEVTVRPIAGTRPRGASPEEDEGLARALVSDEKERAEHLMLVDLGRNDVGRVARYGTVRVTDLLTIERYSHVQHMVSEVRGRLKDGYDALDVFKACFPAGTVTGAPKVRAMEIIDELEPERRRPYAGAVGYVGWGAMNLDTAVAPQRHPRRRPRPPARGAHPRRQRRQGGGRRLLERHVPERRPRDRGRRRRERRHHLRQGGVPGEGGLRSGAAPQGGARFHEPQARRGRRHDPASAAGERLRRRARYRGREPVRRVSPQGDGPVARRAA